MIEAAETLGEKVGTSAACRALGVPRSTLYRARNPKTASGPRPAPPRALSQDEKAAVRAELNSERFCDYAPREVYSTLLDEDTYYCHWRTMYRIQEEHGEVRERRDQCRRPAAPKPTLEATGPNQLWSWDITRLKGPSGIQYYLYAVIDVFSRYVVGWMIASKESAELAEKLIMETCTKQGIEPKHLTLHADRGSAMRSKTVAQLLIDLGVAKSHSRPYTPTDNPYSEAHFKTLKYRPDYPQQFDGIIQARRWARAFFDWYNQEHHHSGLGLMTPATVHHGQVESVRENRQQVLETAYAAHPERFVGGKPTPPQVPEKVWINQPTKESDEVKDSAGSATTDTEPGAQAGSSDPMPRSIDKKEGLKRSKTALKQTDKPSISHSKLRRELSQSR